MIEDEIALLKVGGQEVTNYNSIEFVKPQTSAWLEHPFRYKFTGFELTLSFDQNVTFRETYGFLEWLGDIGGLLDALFISGSLILAPISAFALKSHLGSRMFSIKPKRKEEKPRYFKYKEDDFASSIRTKDRDIPNLKHASKAKTLQSIKDSMGHLQDLEEKKFFRRWLCCKSKYDRLLEKTA